MDKIAEIEARRAARKAEGAAQKNTQLAIDLEALDALEVELGDESVKRVDVERWTLGLPTLVVVRAPTKPEFKRYQDMCKGRGKDPGDPLAAATLIFASCVRYPTEKEVIEKMIEASPGIPAIAGVAAVQLGSAREAEEGKG